MIGDLGRAIGESVRLLTETFVHATGEIARRYRGAEKIVSDDSATKQSLDAAGRKVVGGQAESAPDGVGNVGARPTGAPIRAPSPAELTESIAAAQRSGQPDRIPMAAGNSVTELLDYPNGYQVMHKAGLTPAHRSAEILAAAVGRAIDAPVASVIAGDRDSVFMSVLPGRAVPGTYDDPHALAAMEAVASTPGARKLGLLDVLVRNWDRSGNWLQDGDHVYGHDHAVAFTGELDPSVNPFASHYVQPNPPGSATWYEWKPNDLTQAELDHYEREIGALRPLFDEHARMDWAGGGEPVQWYDGVLSQPAGLRANAVLP